MSQITIYYLEMTSPSALIEPDIRVDLQILEMARNQFQFNRFLYQFVGESWHWLDKLPWSDEMWKNYVEKPGLRTWIAYHEGAIAGYYELQQTDGGNTEIAYFGLAPDCIGKGFGGYLLSQAIKCAWNWSGTNRVWLHTCTLDHPNALNNYQSRGMKLYDEEVSEES
jgi:GNAT superfamily N-acetyltransferase